ncbi:hypothetical protein [Ferruginibacter sp.]
MSTKIVCALLQMIVLFSITTTAQAQQFPNNEFKKWGEYGCPESWSCNNDADCRGKVTKADKIKGGAKLTVMHCFDPAKEDRSNNVNMSYDELSAKISKGKKVKISFDYSYTPVGNDEAYIKIDADFDEEVNNAFPMFTYNDSDNGTLKPGTNVHAECFLNFNPSGAKQLVSPQACNANSIRTAFGIMPAANTTDVHKGSTLVIYRIKIEII